MHQDKPWLYCQGNWVDIDDLAVKLSADIDNWPGLTHCSQTPRTYGVPGKHYVSIYYGPLFPEKKDAPIAYPDYPYYVEVEIEGVTDHLFYIADDPSDLQLVPRLVD